MAETNFKYEIVPLVGVSPILFGMTREESRAVMRKPFKTFSKSNDSSSLVDAYHNSSFQVFFDANERVEYVELSRFPVQVKGISVFETKAEDVIAMLTKEVIFDENDPELGYSYTFPDLELSLWRPIIPEEDQEESDLNGRYFATIGIGKRGYYSINLVQ